MPAPDRSTRGQAAAGIRFVLGLLAVLAFAPAAVAAAGSAPHLADRVVIEKGKRILRLYAGVRQLASFQVALGRDPVGRKECQGDNRTPEGFYQVSGRKENSDFHRALRISYPSPDDIARAHSRGCDPGGDIMIHGLRKDVGRYHRLSDWTKGCVAVTNEEIERIWRMVPDGVWVEIRP